MHLSPAFKSEDELADAVVYADAVSGQVVHLRDVAEIVRNHGRTESLVETDGKRCLLVSLEMKQGHNIVAFGKEIDQVIAQYNAEGDGKTTVTRIANQPEVVSTSVNHFMRDFLISIIYAGEFNPCAGHGGG